MKNPFYDPKVKINTRTGEQAYQDYLDRMKNEKQNKPVTKKTQPQAPINVKSNINDAESYLILPGKAYGNYSYPDLLVSIDKFYHNHTWYKAHEALNKEDSFMLTIRQYADFLDLLRSGKVNNGKDNLVDKVVIDKILDEILTVKNPWRSEWLDAKFSKKGGLIKKDQWYITYHNIDNGKISEVTEELEDCLIEDKTPGINLDSWLSNSTKHGLPDKKTSVGDLYYWGPRRDNTVVGFVANSNRAGLDCFRDPGYSDRALGVRRAKILK